MKFLHLLLLAFFILPLCFVLLMPIVVLGYVWGFVSGVFTDAAQNGRDHWNTYS